MYKAAAHCTSFPWSWVQLSGTLGPHLGDLGVEALNTVSLHMEGGHFYLVYTSNGMDIN